MSTNSSRPTPPADLPGVNSPEVGKARATVNRVLALARADPNAFISLCFTDPNLNPIVQAPVHKELQAFLTRHPRALVELPRDHGKSFQVCGRLLWELGGNPGLRVKVVCATEAVAAERSRFLRDAIAHNTWVHRVFPELVPATP